MGEIAEMMLDGTLCQVCGGLVDDEGGQGFPRTCGDCVREERRAPHKLATCVRRPQPVAFAKVKCPTCGKKVKHNGLADHQRDAHKNCPSGEGR